MWKSPRAALATTADLARLADLMGRSSVEVLRRNLHLVTSDLQEIHAQAGPVDKL